MTDDELKVTQEKALVALLAGATKTKAAAEAGVSEITIHRWFREEAFLSRFVAEQRQLFELNTASLHEAAGEALATLRDIMGDTEGKTGPKVSAARTVLELARGRMEIAEIKDRLSSLERSREEQA